MGVTRFATRTATRTGVKASRLTVRIAVATAVSALWGWWYDRPGMVRDKALESPFEHRAQIASSIFWPALALWLAGGAAGSPAFVASLAEPLALLPYLAWVVVVGLFATVVLMRRIMAAAGRGWPLGALVRATRRWLAHYPALTGGLVVGCAVVPALNAAGDISSTVTRAIPVATVLGVGALIALREAAWQRRSERMLPALAQVHGVTEAVMGKAVLMPRKGRGFVMVVVPPQVVTNLDGLDARLARHLPMYEAKVSRDPIGAVTSITYNSTGSDTAATRALLEQTRGMLTALTPIMAPLPSRPDEHSATLADSVGKTMALDVEAVLGPLGWSLVEWLPAERQARVARLDPEVVRVRQAIAERRRCEPWDLDLVLSGVDRPVGVQVLRAPTIPDPDKRRQDWLRDVTDVLPSSGDEKWVYSDHGDEGLALTLRKDPLTGIVPFDADLTERISPDTPWKVGVDEDGEEVLIDLAASAHMLIAGATRSGKSVCTYSLITHVLRMGESARLLVADPNDTTIAPFESQVAWSTTSTHPDDVTAMLEWVRKEMDRRKPLLREMRTDKITHFTPEVPMIVVIIDEAANYLRHNDKVAAAALAGELLAVVSQGAKYGVRLVLITQRPDSTILPTSTRAQLSARICFRVEDAETAKMAFPDLSEPEALLTLRPGVGFVKEVAGRARRFRSVFLDDHWAAADGLGFAQPKVDVYDEAAPGPATRPKPVVVGPADAVTEEKVLDLSEIALDDFEPVETPAPAKPSKWDDVEW